MKKPHLIAIFILIAFGIFIYSLFQEKSNKTYIYAMALTPDIIDKDLILNKNPEDIEDIFKEKQTGTTDDIYEPDSMDLSKDIIVDASVTVKKKNKPKKFFLTKHTVKEGESLWSISKNYDITVNSILNFNTNLQKKIITENMVLNIPSLDGILITVQPNETLNMIAQRYKIDINEIKEYNDISDAKLVKNGTKLFLPGKNLEPVKVPTIKKFKKPKKEFEIPTRIGYISSIFGNRFHPIYKRWLPHDGIDIAAKTGTKIYSAADGKVTFVGWVRGYGRVVVIRHTKGFSTRYAHLSGAIVHINEWVDQGQLIGYMGDSGRVTGTHLHFEIRRNEQALNPAKFIDFSKLFAD